MKKYKIKKILIINNIFCTFIDIKYLFKNFKLDLNFSELEKNKFSIENYIFFDWKIIF